jgi:hypothetical protein
VTFNILSEPDWDKAWKLAETAYNKYMQKDADEVKKINANIKAFETLGSVRSGWEMIELATTEIVYRQNYTEEEFEKLFQDKINEAMKDLPNAAAWFQDQVKSRGLFPSTYAPSPYDEEPAPTRRGRTPPIIEAQGRRSESNSPEPSGSLRRGPGYLDPTAASFTPSLATAPPLQFGDTSRIAASSYLAPPVQQQQAPVSPSTTSQTQSKKGFSWKGSKGGGKAGPSA